MFEIATLNFLLDIFLSREMGSLNVQRLKEQSKERRIPKESSVLLFQTIPHAKKTLDILAKRYLLLNSR
jgi:hypothetical protein